MDSGQVPPVPLRPEHGGLLLLLPVAMLCRWCACGIGPMDGLQILAFVGAYVLLPGIALALLLRLGLEDFVSLASIGGALGCAHLTLTFLVARSLGQDWLWLAAPAAVVSLACWRSWRTRRALAPRAPAGVPLLALAGLVLIALLAQQQRSLYSVGRLDLPVPTDLLFHAGNAVALTDEVPPQDVRLAGRALAYHFFSGVLPSAASIATGLPVGDLALVAFPVLTIVWMAFALCHAGLVFTGRMSAGVISAALVLFHLDFGETLGLGRDCLESLLSQGLYVSDSTLLGLSGLLPTSVLLAEWIAGAGPSGPLAGALVGLAFWISGTKASVLPAVVAGLLFAAAVSRDSGRARRLLSAAFVVGAGAMPVTVWIATRPGSLAQMLQWAPGATLLRSPFWYGILGKLGFHGGSWSGAPPTAWALLPLVLVGWVIGFLGPAALLGAAGLATGDRDRRFSWLAGVAAAGLAAALVLDTESLDQLTFAFGGQMLLAVVGGGVASKLVSLRRLRWVAIPILALVAAPIASHAARAAPEVLGTDLEAALQPMPSAVARYAAGLGWIKANTSADTVLVTRHSALATSILAERRSFYSLGLFTAEAHSLCRRGIAREPFPRRRELRRRAAGLDPAAVRAVSDLVGGHPEVLVIVDAVEVSGEPGINLLDVRRLAGAPLQPAGLALVYASDVMRVYRYRD